MKSDALQASSSSGSETGEVIAVPAQCHVKIDGKEIKNLISRVELDQMIDYHHRLKVTVRHVAEGSQGKGELDPDLFASYLGKSITLTLPTLVAGKPSQEALEFVGIVTEIQFDNRVDSINKVHIIAPSPTIMMDGAKKDVFHRHQSACDIIDSILRNYPLTVGQMASTDKTLDFSVQYEETDYEYIMRLATEAGLFAFYDGKEFHVTKPSSSRIEKLGWPKTLGSLAINIGAEPMEFRSSVYDYEKKKTFSQDSRSVSGSMSLSGIARSSPEASGKVFKESSFIKVAKIKDARALDESLDLSRRRSVGRMVRSSGHSILPQLRVGQCAKVEGLDKLDGLYWITRVRHIMDNSGRYHNEFECQALEVACPELKSKRPRLTQLQPAVVMDNKDPAKLARVKISFPWSNSQKTPWARVATSHAGSDRGAYCIPEIGDEVLVGYEFGDPDLPVILASLYNKEEAPPSKAISDDNLLKSFTTKGGNEISISDESGKEAIRITNKGGKNQLILTLDGPKITIESEGDIDINGDNITIEGKSDVTLKSGKKVVIDAGGDYELSAGGNLKSKAGGTYDAEGAAVNVKGNPIKLN